MIVLYPLDDDWDETEWLRAAVRNPAFDYLKESADEIYSVKDGKAFHDEE